jgi:hypothetical protein
MVHQVVAKLATAVGEPVGELRSVGIEKNTSGLESGSANKKDASLEFKGAFGLRVNDLTTL